MARLHVPLSVDIFSDDRMIDVSPLALLAYIAALCIAKRHETDGTVTVAQVRRELPDIGDIEPLAKELVEAGLWEHNTDARTYAISSWLSWNPSKAEIADIRSKRAKAGTIGGRHSAEARSKSKQVASTNASKMLEQDQATLEPKRSDAKRSNAKRSNAKPGDATTHQGKHTDAEGKDNNREQLIAKATEGDGNAMVILRSLFGLAADTWVEEARCEKGDLNANG